MSHLVTVHVKYTVVVRLTLDRVNWLEVFGIVLAIINLHTMKLIVPTKFTRITCTIRAEYHIAA